MTHHPPNWQKCLNWSVQRDLFPNLPIPQKQLKCYAVLIFLFCQNSELVRNQEVVNCQL